MFAVILNCIGGMPDSFLLNYLLFYYYFLVFCFQKKNLCNFCS